MSSTVRALYKLKSILLSVSMHFDENIRLRVISLSPKVLSKFKHPSINLGDAWKDFIFEFQERLPPLLKFA